MIAASHARPVVTTAHRMPRSAAVSTAFESGAGVPSIPPTYAWSGMPHSVHVPHKTLTPAVWAKYLGRVGKLLGRAVQVVALLAFLRLLGGPARTGQGAREPRQGSSPEGRTWHLALSIYLFLAIGLAAISVNLRLLDNAAPPTSESSSPESIGVYVSRDVPVTTWPTLGSASFYGPRHAWSVRIYPGVTTRASVALVQLPGLSDMKFDRPVRVVVEFPAGARLLESTLRVGHPDACATWWDGRTLHAVRAVLLQRSATDPVSVSCEIPAAGQPENLFIEFNAEWVDSSRAEYGFARAQYAVHQEMWPRSVDAEGLVSVPVDFIVEMAPGESLVNLSSPPDITKLDALLWRADGGEFEFQFTVERPKERLWVQPLLDVSLLMAGVAFGLIPWVWDRRHTSR